MILKGELTALTLFVVFVAASDDTSDEFKSDSKDLSKKIENLRVEGSEYLQKVMLQLHSDRVQNEIIQVPDEPSALYHLKSPGDVYDELYKDNTYGYNISGPTPPPEVEAEAEPEIPPLDLSKEELLALYQAAVAKATKLKFHEGESRPAGPPVIALDDDVSQVKPYHQGQVEGPLSGYYYYYFPIKSFATQKGHQKEQQSKPTTSLPPAKPTPTPTQHLHVTMVDSSNKSVEPLFMAISSFIGMALMFFFSVILVPRFQKLRSKNAVFKDEDEMSSFGSVILEAMAGRDCSERLGCEIARIFRGLKSDSKTLRVLEIVLPPNLSKQVSHIRKAAGKRGKCSYISCKDKKVKWNPATNSTIKIYRPKPWKEKVTVTPHELWMSHFENNKKPLKPNQQRNEFNSSG
ncbi:hypothetical protein RUM44_006626 [Polyplax serrata]|uniref:Uncharacterized protein n=1 Tax=Polyplax serrata TaxID=468196 RepID=A0ABR1AIL5_POLSC